MEEIWLLGGVVQVNGEGLMREPGSRARKCAEQLLGEGLVGVIASDGHRPMWRPPDLSGVFEKLEREYRSEDVRRWMVDNPALILADRELTEAEPRSR